MDIDNSVDYYCWLMSDWAYLGGVRFRQIAARHGLAVNVIPMRMQEVYKESGGILLDDRSWQRRDYRIHELKRWSARLGVPVNIEPKFFPTDVDMASCMVIAAQRAGLAVLDLCEAMMRAMWVADLDLADPAVLVEIANSVGMDGRELLASATTDAVRSEYAGNTQRALAAGVFGSPFYVYSGEKFWGQDRLDMFEEAVVRRSGRDLGRRPD
ncbi:2-hydroxychromene-2-carboxylate isomerase [Hansschlegelia quercus]|uniref:2-hydroxychromene-2-carboxylate isomerase n=1 Tax=Hansschlegelia quercus TaxID=2528245 RepID=A0A4Q9GJT3_9HYPH|nr:2-hydroxychromene-2-carboxylate isomerase [Hansschlegelia quercus]TBN53551.1 2-hydroxychromene-2-carboxylate isomerase [Hansschlegelia quercus]